MNDEEIAALVAEHARYKAALQLIRSHYGQVCDEYELCDHKGCYGSYGAWATADAALRTLPPTDKTTPGNMSEQ